MLMEIFQSAHHYWDFPERHKRDIGIHYTVKCKRETEKLSVKATTVVQTAGSLWETLSDGVDRQA